MVNANMLMFNGNTEDRGPVWVNDIALHTPLKSWGVYFPLSNHDPSIIVAKQLTNNNAKNNMPRISELKIDDNTKKLTKINGANRNPTYNNDVKFKMLTGIL